MYTCLVCGRTAEDPEGWLHKHAELLEPQTVVCPDCAGVLGTYSKEPRFRDLFPEFWKRGVWQTMCESTEPKEDQLPVSDHHRKLFQQMIRCDMQNPEGVWAWTQGNTSPQIMQQALNIYREFFWKVYMKGPGADPGGKD